MEYLITKFDRDIITKIDRRRLDDFIKCHKLSFCVNMSTDNECYNALVVSANQLGIGLQEIINRVNGHYLSWNYYFEECLKTIEIDNFIKYFGIAHKKIDKGIISSYNEIFILGIIYIFTLDVFTSFLKLFISKLPTATFTFVVLFASFNTMFFVQFY